MSEEVLVFNEGLMEGFSKEFWENRYSESEKDNDYFWMKCLPQSYFVPRRIAEDNPNWKQIIPYTILYQDTSEGMKVCTYKRTKHGGESRLHEKYSIGIGGHINKQDVINGVLKIENCISRELAEEVILISGKRSTYTEVKNAILYDPSNDVGKVHFGLITIICTQSISVHKNEASISRIQWMNQDELASLDNLENWSQIALRNI